MLKFILLALLVQFSFAYDYFHIWYGKVYDPNGREFLIRGINTPNAFWDNYNRNYVIKSFPYVAKTGANLVRIVWKVDRLAAEQVTVANLDAAIQAAINNKLIPMVELHDATCSSNKDDLLRMARWWATNVALLNKYKKYLFLNIANEWGPGDNPIYWRDAYKEAIKIIRNTGWGGPLVIDAGGCGQNPYGIIKYGNELLAADNWKNVIFSVHMYYSWRNDGGYPIGARLKEMKTANLTVIVGEFALDYADNSACQWKRIDAWEIMRQCKTLNIGYIGWSWLGNSKHNEQGCSLSDIRHDIIKGDAYKAADWLKNEYTEWGNALISYTGYGIKDTSKRSAMFT